MTTGDDLIESAGIIGLDEMQKLVAAWRTYREEHGLALPDPKICVEDARAVGRFDELLVSCWVSRSHGDDVRLCASEAEARWIPVVWVVDEVPAWTFCNRLAAILDRRIPW